MGTVHVENLVRIPGARITAVCDIVQAHAERASGIITTAGQAKPTLYTRGPTDFLRLCETEQLDLVYTATPWEWHVPVCVAAMRNDKHAATEVPAAYTIEECWQLVEEAEKYRKHCVMMENCNYDRPELLALNLVRKGLLGEVLHAEGGYLHDLRSVKFIRRGRRAVAPRPCDPPERQSLSDPRPGAGLQLPQHQPGRRVQLPGFDERAVTRLAGLGARAFRRGHAQRAEQYVLGDVNTSLIKTAQGKTISVVHDTNLPRPYSRIHMVQGTRGIFQGYPDRVYLEGRSPAHKWQPAAELYPEFEHPLWKFDAAQQATTGHGGMDFLEDWRLIKCLREGTPTDMNVYDAAALSAVGPLSEWSVANGSRPIEFPDFTRGGWKTAEPWAIVSA